MAEFDVVLRGGRVIDPGSSRDEIADVAFKDGRVAAVGQTLGAGRDERNVSGAIVMPGSHSVLGTPAKDDYADRILPGNGGAVTLAGEQLQKTAAALRGFNGATEEGTVIRAPTVLSDGTAAVIALDSRTGRLIIVRQE